MDTPKGQVELKKILKAGGQDEEGGTESMAGCTANVSMLVNGQLICANAGDSRTLLCSRGKPLRMSVDHKPEDEIEYKRITNAGGSFQFPIFNTFQKVL